MPSDQRHQQMDTARVRADLTVEDLWLRYVALGGTEDACDLDGYLQGLIPLRTSQQTVLALTLNEALGDCYRASLIPLSAPRPVAGVGEQLGRISGGLAGGHR